MTTMDFLPLDDVLIPQVLAAEKDFLVVYKPPKMHSAPLPRSLKADTLFHWCALKFPETADLPGRQAGEGGLLHRLDYETRGLLLVARTQAGMESLLEQQREGRILKEYSALTLANSRALAGFPAEKPVLPPWVLSGEGGAGLVQIKSAFRPYGPGRKAVRPVSGGEQYNTEILETRPQAGGITAFRVRIIRGFRHQIRCHLAWLGAPILNDALYGGEPSGGGFLALAASALYFTDPSSGTERAFAIRQPGSPLR